MTRYGVLGHVALMTPPTTDAFAALGYDAARLIVDALGRTGKRKTKNLQEALEQTRGFAGVTGSISFTRESHVPEKTVWVIRMQSGERTLAAAVVPESVPAPIVKD